jgi:hypothetical protein
MAKKITNHQLANHYVNLNKTWEQYSHLWLFWTHIEIQTTKEKIWLKPHMIWNPNFLVDWSKETLKDVVERKYIDYIDDYDTMFLINKTIYQFLSRFISFEWNELPEYK